MANEEIETDFVEVQGTVRKVWKKTTDGNARLYSFDAKATWHETMVAAYMKASGDGTLPSGDGYGDQDETSEFQVFLMALINEICRLRQGESLKVFKDEKRVYVMREEVAMACSSDSVVAVDFMVGGDSDGE